MEKLTVSKELMQKVLDYLVTKPYIEVTQLIASIMQETSKENQKANE